MGGIAVFKLLVAAKGLTKLLLDATRLVVRLDSAGRLTKETFVLGAYGGSGKEKESQAHGAVQLHH